MGLTLLAHASWRMNLWDHNFTTVVYLINMLHTLALSGGKTSINALHNKHPNYKNLKSHQVSSNEEVPETPNIDVSSQHDYHIPMTHNQTTQSDSSDEIMTLTHIHIESIEKSQTQNVNFELSPIAYNSSPNPNQGGVSFVPIDPASNMSFRAYNDSDWASDPDDMKSTSGSYVYLGPNLVLWSSKN
ncbi:hypothetical protein KIW84_020634 [Lathyrus oleraceus]|uniref:Uncharacterized protein n=1 Tax=Pisum sativum TaxID=3888 RepID=A0A9D5B8V7_PEA|nr:hypothetical protein KIW84_020634 [Pisum sativum]